MKKNVHVNLLCRSFWVEKLDVAVKEGRYSNRSEAVRAGIRLVVREIEEEKRKTQEVEA